MASVQSLEIGHNFHHVFFHGRRWESANVHERFRNDPRLIVPMNPDIHDALHHDISEVPLISHKVARTAYNRSNRRFEAGKYIRNLLTVADEIERASEDLAHTDWVAYQLSSLAVLAIREQRHYLGFGFVDVDPALLSRYYRATNKHSTKVRQENIRQSKLRNKKKNK